MKHAEHAALALALGDSVAEQIKRESEWESLEASIEAEFEAIRSRGTNAHVVPTHCGEALCLFPNPNLSTFLFCRVFAAMN